MFVKISALAALLPLVSALTIQTPANWDSAIQANITWTSASTDPSTWSFELVNPVNFHNSFGLANNVDPSTGVLLVELPVVPPGDGYLLQAVNISNINDVFAQSGDFAIAPDLRPRRRRDHPADHLPLLPVHRPHLRPLRRTRPHLVPSTATARRTSIRASVRGSSWPSAPSQVPLSLSRHRYSAFGIYRTDFHWLVWSPGTIVIPSWTFRPSRTTLDFLRWDFVTCV
ncbi:hypothetical protein BKA93DRAFT_254086 [Sparassis latifolia]